MYTINIPMSKDEYILLMQIMFEYLSLINLKELYSIEEHEFYTEEKYFKLRNKMFNVVFSNGIYSNRDKEEIEEKIKECIKYNDECSKNLLKKISEESELNANVYDIFIKAVQEYEKNKG